MPGGVPVATVAIGKAGATNAGLLVAQILSTTDAELANKPDARRETTKQQVLKAQVTWCDKDYLSRANDRHYRRRTALLYDGTCR